MILNDAGMMVHDTIEEIDVRYPNILIPHYVIMPNHVHLIIQNIEGQNLMDVIRWVKSNSTNKYIHGVKEKGWIPFVGKLWQRSFYDHIIRNQHSYDFIANYIFCNPARWGRDKLNADCIEDSDNIDIEIKKLEGM